MLDIPVKLVLASSVLVLNFFTSRAQQQQLRQILAQARDPHKVSPEAKEELFNFYDYFKSSNSRLCPIMIREYDPSSEDQEYTTGLLINGDFEWVQALGAIRKHIKIEPGVSLSFFCGREIIGNGIVINFYEKYKNIDGILYMQYMRLESYG
jgi:hypothetical protein